MSPAMQPKPQAGVGSVGLDGHMSSAWAIGPTKKVIGTTTVLIFDKIKCNVVSDRTPEKRPAEQLAMLSVARTTPSESD